MNPKLLLGVAQAAIIALLLWTVSTVQRLSIDVAVLKSQWEQRLASNE